MSESKGAILGMCNPLLDSKIALQDIFMIVKLIKISSVYISLCRSSGGAIEEV
jgi:hypothetical protein